jgi:hypothetical protein
MYRSSAHCCNSSHSWQAGCSRCAVQLNETFAAVCTSASACVLLWSCTLTTKNPHVHTTITRVSLSQSDQTFSFQSNLTRGLSRKHCRAFTLVLQLLVDVGLGDEGDANATAAALSALSALTRNLPSAESGLFPADAPSGGPDPVNLLFALCDRFWTTAELQSQHGGCRECHQIVSRALGLLTSVAANDSGARLRLRHSQSAASAWTGVLQDVVHVRIAC